MKADNTTLVDLSIFHPDAEQSVFHRLNHTQTNAGKEYLRQLLSNPLTSVSSILDTQQTIQSLGAVQSKWPPLISNGTIMVLEKYYESQIDHLPGNPGLISSLLYKLTSTTDYSLTKYTVLHAIDFVKGLTIILQLIEDSKKPNFSLVNIYFECKYHHKL
jgi:hypothetical protein